MYLARLTKNVVDTAIKLEDLSEELRGYLGMSSLGHPCMRKLWYGFRLCGSDLPQQTARMLRLFNRGHREEPYVYERLLAAGIKVLPVNPATGKQFEYVGSYGHAKGHSDGLAYNIPDLPWRWVLLECKTHNDKNFTAVSNRGVKKAMATHYCQTQRYMERHRAQFPEYDVTHTLYIGVNKNNDSWHTELIPYDAEAVDMLINREMSVIETDVVPDRLNSDPNFFTCRFCDYNPMCHGGRDYPVHCRTCKNVAVCDGGIWKCEKPLNNDRLGPLTLADQLEGCGGYVKNFTL